MLLRKPKCCLPEEATQSNMATLLIVNPIYLES